MEDFILWCFPRSRAVILRALDLVHVGLQPPCSVFQVWPL